MTLARAAGKETSGRPAPVHFASWRALTFQYSRERWSTGESILDVLADRVDVLAIDDLDVGTMTPWKEEVLLNVLQRPVGGRRLIVTGNVPPNNLVERFGERCADRLLDPSLFALIPVHGRSWRRRDQ